MEPFIDGIEKIIQWNCWVKKIKIVALLLTDVILETRTSAIFLWDLLAINNF